MKVCRVCNKVHMEPTNTIGEKLGFIWFNCDCGSTLVLKGPTDPLEPVLAPVDTRILVSSQKTDGQ